MRKSVKEIKAHLEKNHPSILQKVRQRFTYKYPKITIFVLVIIIAYLIFKNPLVAQPLQALGNFSYLGVFIAGLLFSYGFTTPISVGLFITLDPSNIFLAAIVGGIGAYIADYTIYKIVKTSFMDEFELIEKTRPMQVLEKKIKTSFSKKMQLYLLFFCAGFVIASPLPDEVGVALLAGVGHIKPSTFTIVSLVGNMVGIFIMLLL